MGKTVKETAETIGTVEASHAAETLLAEAREQAKEELAQAQAAKAEAEKLLEEARAAKEELAVKAAASTGEELVPVRLFKDNEKYKDDVFVAVNGKSWQIKRGETVMVPAYVADVVEQSLNQDAATASMLERQSAEFEAEAAARKL